MKPSHNRRDTMGPPEARGFGVSNARQNHGGTWPLCLVPALPFENAAGLRLPGAVPLQVGGQGSR
jgi:hypothetical protein